VIRYLLVFDEQLFLIINHLPHNFFLHSFFASLSGVGKWGLIWVVFALALFFWEKKKNPQKLIALFLGLGASTLVVEIVKNITKESGLKRSLLSLLHYLKNPLPTHFLQVMPQ